MPACGSTNSESPDGAVVAVVVGVGAAAVVLAGLLTGVAVVLPVVLPFAVATAPRGAAGVEQPAIESTTATTTVSRQVAGQALDPRGRPTSRLLIRVCGVRETPGQLASWTTEASPTLA